jgi:hypothetical protein
MTNPTLDYWSGPSHPIGWRTGLFWSYAGGVAFGMMATTVPVIIFAPGGGRMPDMCLITFVLFVGALISASICLLAADLRARLLRHKYRVRGRLPTAIVGCLYYPAILCINYLLWRSGVRGDNRILIVVIPFMLLLYHVAAAIILVRPGDAVVPFVTALPPTSDPDIPLAQLADPPAATPPSPSPQPDNSPLPPVQ